MSRAAVPLLLPVMALSALGLAQGLWSEAVEIRGTVSTANLDPVWFFRSCDDEEAEGKDVGSWQVGVDPNNRERLLVTITNGYPSYQLYCEAHLANDGTVPVKVKRVTVTNANPQALTVTAVHEEDGGAKELEPCGFTPPWGTRPSEVPARCRTEIKLTVHLEAGAQESAAYTFTVEVELEQAT